MCWKLGVGRALASGGLAVAVWWPGRPLGGATAFPVSMVLSAEHALHGLTSSALVRFTATAGSQQSPSSACLCWSRHRVGGWRPHATLPCQPAHVTSAPLPSSPASPHAGQHSQHSLCALLAPLPFLPLLRGSQPWLCLKPQPVTESFGAVAGISSV